MGARPPPGFDQGTYDHICSCIRRLNGLHKFSVAVVYHADYFWFDPFYKGNEFADLPYRKCGTGIIAFGPLDRYQLCFVIDSLCNVIIVKGAVWQQIHLAIRYAVLL